MLEYLKTAIQTENIIFLILDRQTFEEVQKIFYHKEWRQVALFHEPGRLQLYGVKT